MKTNTNRKIGLKKLTIAKINIDAMNAVKGGSSSPSDTSASLAPDNCPNTVQVY